MKTCWRCKKPNALVFSFGLFVQLPDAQTYGPYQYGNADPTTVCLCPVCLDEIKEITAAIVKMFEDTLTPEKAIALSKKMLGVVADKRALAMAARFLYDFKASDDLDEALVDRDVSTEQYDEMLNKIETMSK